jgi:recombination protein RecA
MPRLLGDAVFTLDSLPAPVAGDERIPPGRLIELSGTGAGARTTFAVTALREAQREGETAAWIQLEHGALFPPDLAESGVDLDTLIVVHVPRAVGAHGLCRAAEILLHSGALGLVILDMCDGIPLDSAWQGRLLGLARRHHSRLCVLTHKPDREASLGPLVGLRIEAMRTRVSRGRFSVEPRILKNKSGIPVPETSELRRGPWGFR